MTYSSVVRRYDEPRTRIQDEPTIPQTPQLHLAVKYAPDSDRILRIFASETAGMVYSANTLRELAYQISAAQSSIAAGEFILQPDGNVRTRSNGRMMPIRGTKAPTFQSEQDSEGIYLMDLGGEIKEARARRMADLARKTTQNTEQDRKNLAQNPRYQSTITDPRESEWRPFERTLIRRPRSMFFR